MNLMKRAALLAVCALAAVCVVAPAYADEAVDTSADQTIVATDNAQTLADDPAEPDADVPDDSGEDPEPEPSTTEGWQTINNATYYYVDNAPVTGEQTIDGSFYFFNDKGVMQKGWKQWSDGSWSYFGSDGAAITGWKKDSKNWYYMSPSTYKSVRYTQVIDGNTYYFNSSYQMYVGWLKINGKYRYYGNNGMLTGTQSVCGINCTFDSNGYAASSSDAMKMVSKAQSFYSNTSWLILIDTTKNEIAIFHGSHNNWTLKYFWQCSTGAANSPTVLGEYTVGSKGYSFGHGYTCYYYTQFYGDYLMHSVTYYENTFNVMEGKMGVNISAGCVRMTIDHAYWVYCNIPQGTKVYTFK